MGILKGLKGINKYYADEDAKYNKPDENYVKVPYLKIADGQTLKGRFLQELDEDSPGYNKKAGVGFIAIEHQSPKNFKIRGLCSKEEESDPCFGCEQHQKNYKAGWRQKSKLYINMLVVRPDGTEEVVVLSQGNGPKSVTPWLLEYAGDSGTITSCWFKLKRKGSGQTDTEYTLVPSAPDTTPYDVTQHELFDLNNCVRDIPYEEQKVFYLGSEDPEDNNDVENDSKPVVEW